MRVRPRQFTECQSCITEYAEAVVEGLESERAEKRSLVIEGASRAFFGQEQEKGAAGKQESPPMFFWQAYYGGAGWTGLLFEPCFICSDAFPERIQSFVDFVQAGFDSVKSFIQAFSQVACDTICEAKVRCH